MTYTAARVRTLPHWSNAVGRPWGDHEKNWGANVELEQVDVGGNEKPTCRLRVGRCVPTGSDRAGGKNHCSRDTKTCCLRRATEIK
jgi:hypothetical protein